MEDEDKDDQSPHVNEQYRSFIDEIIASPRDDTARLVFADYLEEAGDPRAELIRIQFQLRDLAPRDKERQKLRTRERRLAKEYGLFTSVPKEAVIKDTYGGFVDSVEMTITRFLKHHPALFSSSPIRKVALKGKSVKFQQLGAVEEMNRLAELTMFSNNVDTVAYCDLVRSPHLRDLEGLRVRCGENYSELLMCIGQDQPFDNLKHLELQGWGADSEVAERDVAVAFAGAEKNRSLLSLSLSNQTDTSIPLLAQSTCFPKIKSLYLGGRFSEKSLRTIQSGPAFKTLIDLKLNSYLRGSGEAFRVSDPLPDLKYLAVGTDLPNSIVNDIVTRYPKLKTLDLSQNRVDDRGAKTLANSPLLKNLERLTLTGNHLTLKGVRMLTDSQYWHDDLNLYLTSNQLTGLQMKSLRKEFGSKFGNFGDIRWLLRSGR